MAERKDHKIVFVWWLPYDWPSRCLSCVSGKTVHVEAILFEDEPITNKNKIALKDGQDRRIFTIWRGAEAHWRLLIGNKTYNYDNKTHIARLLEVTRTEYERFQQWCDKYNSKSTPYNFWQMQAMVLPREFIASPSDREPGVLQRLFCSQAMYIALDYCFQGSANKQLKVLFKGPDQIQTPDSLLQILEEKLHCKALNCECLNRGRIVLKDQ